MAAGPLRLFVRDARGQEPVPRLVAAVPRSGLSVARLADRLRRLLREQDIRSEKPRVADAEKDTARAPFMLEEGSSAHFTRPSRGCQVAMGAALLLGVISACGAFTKAGDKLNKLGAAQTLGNPTELTLRADLERRDRLVASIIASKRMIMVVIGFAATA
ncbi:hypothetical protein AK812_SmicGene17503 [Symbiodinium microadriaticum]|uniref:Uncharacterized protein n=1 Tax=Symbiodinium microadriaticum TaxID=2951 RepID=A0A1Q9DXN7_SYMMI|nr:hypothetical protein AK812_SmicGene17503 [Symbiodinium microadriaticum]